MENYSENDYCFTQFEPHFDRMLQVHVTFPIKLSKQ